MVIEIQPLLLYVHDARMHLPEVLDMKIFNSSGRAGICLDTAERPLIQRDC